MSARSNILVSVEGGKRDAALMKHLLHTYGIEDDHEIYSYNTGIYALYNRMFRDKDPTSLDVLQVLKEGEKDEEKKKLLDKRYSDILLVFDLDPQDTFFEPDVIKAMSEYFVESSDMGKLYLNYPMVEAFYHMKKIPDMDYNAYTASQLELKDGKYKSRVAKECINRDYKKFAINKEECNIVINQNIEKAKNITKNDSLAEIPSGNEILTVQLDFLRKTNEVYVLSTCGFYIYDYNPRLMMGVQS